MKNKKQTMNPSAQGELLMMIFANTQTQINLLDKLPETDFFKQGYKQLCNRIQYANIGKINDMFALMDYISANPYKKEKSLKKDPNYLENRKHLEEGFNVSQEVSDQMIICIENHSLGALLAMLRTLNAGEIKTLPDKHTKIMKHLEPLKV